ncbi:MAG: hypothetical protein WC238_01425 [Parcubacteria group bacterium]|jgi:chromosome segregation ATPase
MQNFSHNSGQGDEDKNAKQDKSRQRQEIQREMIMTESDLRKVTKEKTDLDGEIRALKKEEDHIQMSMQDKKARLIKVEYELTQIDVKIKGLKKKLNLV